MSSNQKAQVSKVRMLDTETGEMLEEGITVHIPRRLKIKGFFMANQNGFEMLAKMELKGESYKVLLFLLGRMDYENTINITQKEISEELNMKKQNVWRAIQALRVACVLNSETVHLMALDPEYGWKGKVRNLTKRREELVATALKNLKRNATQEALMDKKIVSLPTYMANKEKVDNTQNL